MKLHRVRGVGTPMLLLVAGSAWAQDKAGKRAEVQKATASALNNFSAEAA